MKKSSRKNPPSDQELADKYNWFWRHIFPKDSIANKGSGQGDMLARLADFFQKLFDNENLTKPLPIKPKTANQESLHAAVPAMIEVFDSAKQVSPLFGALNQRREYNAFMYELDMRITWEYEFGKPWVGISEEQKKELEKRWPDKTVQIICGVFRPRRKGLEHFTDLNRIRWNLHANNAALRKKFDDLIEAERKRKGIPNPPPNAERRNRGLSWRPLELLDIQQHHVRVLTDSERSQISKAKTVWWQATPPNKLWKAKVS